MRITIKFRLIGTLLLIGFLGVAQEYVADLNVYTTVDKMPRLKGAGNDISRFIRKQVNYSDNLKIKGIEGDVWVSFVVTASGEVTQVELEKGIDKELDARVIEAIKATEDWKPGVLNREKVNTKMRLPVRFQLSSGERQLAGSIKSLEVLGKHPLFVLDNKIVDGLVAIEDYNVESIRIIKGDKAIKLYGDKAVDGVVVMTSKRGTPPLY